MKARFGHGLDDLVQRVQDVVVVRVLLALRCHVAEIGGDLDMHDALTESDTGAHRVGGEDGVVGGAVIADDHADERQSHLAQLIAKDRESLGFTRLGYRDLPVLRREARLPLSEVGQGRDAMRETDQAVGRDLDTVHGAIEPWCGLVIPRQFDDRVDRRAAERRLKPRDRGILRCLIEVRGEEAIPCGRVGLGGGDANATGVLHAVGEGKPVGERIVAARDKLTGVCKELVRRRI